MARQNPNEGNTPPKFVSVIIPVYNDQAGIDACVDALSKQSWPQDHYEIIVVDNGSSPPIRIDSKYKHLVRLIQCHTPGSYAARNAGMSAARGEVLAFTDADCVPDQDWIRSGALALEQENGGSLIGGEIKLFLSKNPTATERYQYITGFMQQENIENQGFTVTANLFATRKQAEKIGPFDEKLLSGGDREWSWRAGHRGFKVRYSQNAIVHTSPRTSLAAAIRQVRRGAGGRLTLRRLGHAHITPAGIKPHRSISNAVFWIFSHPELSAWMRLQVFVVASILKMVQIIETFRLRLGTSPERR